MSFPKKIAILTLSVGSGHVRAAAAVERALVEGEDPFEVRTFDAAEAAPKWFDWLYVRPYWWMLKRAPGLWRRLFERRQRKRHRATAPDWVFRHGCRRLLEQLKAYAPNLVIATEISAAEVAALARREGWCNTPVLAVFTDYHSEPPWAQREIDFYCVGSEEARSQLISWGVSPNRILVSGIPIDPSFALNYDRTELRRSLGLVDGRPVVLVMGGGMGPAPLDEIVRRLEVCGLPLQVLAVAGQGAEMKARVDSLRGKLALDLHAFGWSENVPELMAVSDVLVTKPGGLTTAEALAAGLPMVLTHPIPGPEERHLEYLERNGVALAAQNLKEIPEIVSRVLRNEQQRTEMSRRARELARPDASDTVAQVARALLEKASYIDLLASPPVRSGESAYLM
jgi:processive 1,2-diacylglycerol beta-glucosyltransferase